MPIKRNRKQKAKEKKETNKGPTFAAKEKKSRQKYNFDPLLL